MASRHHTKKVSKHEIRARKVVYEILQYIIYNKPNMVDLNKRYPSPYYIHHKKLALEIVDRHNKEVKIANEIDNVK